MYRRIGFVSLVLVVLGLVTPGSATWSAPLSRPGQSPFGVNSHIGSRYGDFETINMPLLQLAAADTGWAREEFQWSLVRKTDGSYDWGMLDAVIDDLHSRGINIIGLLNDSPNAGPPRTPEQINAFAAFAEAAARRYGDKVRYWEVWNEPENFLYWGGLPDVGEYTRLLIAVSSRIKGVDSGLKVLNAGMVPTHIDYLRGIQQHGGWSSFDILALHPYVDPFTPETGQIGDGGDLSKIQMVNEQFGAKPIWATEFGWATGPSDRAPQQPVDPDTQASYLVRGAALLRAAGVERVIWYKFKDEDAGRDAYGMFNHGAGRTDFSQPKPSYNAFTTLNQQLADSGPATSLPIGMQSIALDFESPIDWQSGDPGRGTLSRSTGPVRSGSAAGALTYSFTSSGNDFVGLNLPQEIPIAGSPSQLGIWVYGNGSGHELLVALRDSQNEVLRFRIGIVGAGERWRFLSTPINGQVEEWRCEGGCINRQLDFPVSLVALLLEDNPDTETGSGTFYMDDLTAMNSAEGVRFSKGGEAVDVLWSLQEGQDVVLGTHSTEGRLTTRSGESRTVTASNGQFALRLGPSPIYLVHNPRDDQGGPTSPTSPPRPTSPLPIPTMPGGTPTPEQPEPRPAPETGCVPPSAPATLGCESLVARQDADWSYPVSGCIREFWEQNGGLSVFGLPITPQRGETIQGSCYAVQWFQRNRLEFHPENNRPFHVLLGLLGSEAVAGRTEQTPGLPLPADLQGSCERVPGAQHEICGSFRNAWYASGLDLNGDGQPDRGSLDASTSLFGLPLTAPRTENLQGSPYTVQWFERARFEWHPETNPPTVLFGLLGNEALDRP